MDKISEEIMNSIPKEMKELFDNDPAIINLYVVMVLAFGKILGKIIIDTEIRIAKLESRIDELEQK